MRGVEELCLLPGVSPKMACLGFHMCVVPFPPFFFSVSNNRAKRSIGIGVHVRRITLGITNRRHGCLGSGLSRGCLPPSCDTPSWCCRIITLYQHSSSHRHGGRLIRRLLRGGAARSAGRHYSQRVWYPDLLFLPCLVRQNSILALLEAWSLLIP